MSILSQQKFQRQRMVNYAKNHSVSDTAIRYGVSRKTAHKWIKRYDGTTDSLMDRSHRPHHSPRKHTESEIRKIRKRLKKYKWTDLIQAYQELVEVCRAFHEKGCANPMMGFSRDETTSVFTVTIYPFFCGTVAHDAEAVKQLNALDPSAGEYIRPSLEKIVRFLDDGCVDLSACAEIENNYDAVILRFFEGDVPMMTCSGDTVSGTKKREERSEAFISNPFTYTFAPIPIEDEGAYFLDMPNLQFSVNKNSPNLDMANEFMRFLITSRELNEMAQKKGLMTPTKDLSFNSMYAAFGSVPESRILSPEVIGVTDDAVIQLRQAGYGVGTGSMTIDEAVARYGSFE